MIQNLIKKIDLCIYFCKNRKYNLFRLSILFCLSIITNTVNIDINYVQNNELKVRKSNDDSEFILVEKEKLVKRNMYLKIELQILYDL